MKFVLGTKWGQRRVRIGLVSLVLSASKGKNSVMASLELRKGKYRVVFRYGGRKFSRSLRTDDKQKAKLSLARVEDNLSRLELGTLDLPREVDLCSFLLSDGRLATKRQAPAIRVFGKLADAYIAGIPTGSIEASTIKGMQTHIRHLKRLIGPSFRIGEMSFEVIQRYLDQRRGDKGRRGRPVSAATIKKEIVTLSAIWLWAKRMGYVESKLPKRGLRYPKVNEKPPFQTRSEIEYQIATNNLSEVEAADLWDCLFLTLEEIEELLQTVKNQSGFDFIYPMVAFAAHTGARRSEILRSRTSDIDLVQGVAMIREKKRVRGKTSTRRVPISPFLSEVLSAWIKNRPAAQHLFTFQQTDVSLPIHSEPLTRDQAHHHLRHTLEASCWENVRGWHTFRHSFCSNCAAKGLDQRIINAWVGHQTEDMVRRYRHLIPSQQQEEIRRVFAG